MPRGSGLGTDPHAVITEGSRTVCGALLCMGRAGGRAEGLSHPDRQSTGTSPFAYMPSAKMTYVRLPSSAKKNRLSFFDSKGEGRRKKEEGRRKKEGGIAKKEDKGRRKKEDVGIDVVKALIEHGANVKSKAGEETLVDAFARSWRPGAFADSIACSLALCQSTLVKAGALPQ